MQPWLLYRKPAQLLGLLSPLFGTLTGCNAHKTPFFGAFAFPAVAQGGGDASKVRLPQFSGKEAEYQGWKTQALAYFRKKGLISSLTCNSAPPVYTKTQARQALIQVDETRRPAQRKLRERPTRH